MSYKVEEIEGIGQTYATKLQGIGITTTEELLQAFSAPIGRKKAANDTGISEKHLLEWANMADLMRVSGVGKQYAELLEEAGVDTIKELRHRNAENLAAKIKEVNDVKNLANATPSTSQVEEWIEQAKKIEPTITY